MFIACASVSHCTKAWIAITWIFVSRSIAAAKLQLHLHENIPLLIIEVKVPWTMELSKQSSVRFLDQKSGI